MAKITLDPKQEILDEKQVEILEKYDKESKVRRFANKNIAKAIYWIAVSVSLYHFITSYFGYPATLKHRSLHVAMMLFMTFFLYPATVSYTHLTLPTICSV